MENEKNINPILPPEKSEEKIKKGANDFLEGIIEFLRKTGSLKGGLDKEGTIINIKSNKKMEGANAWLLMCSIFIASLGLDLNSPAVIIGAMLISPLMAPILGIGLAVGVNDRNTLEVSGRHLIIAIVIALLTSTLYFFITGYLGLGKGFTVEIEGRTSPNVLDALVAFIGGLAGIISSSRKDKSNAIPGVAIATALMPPLCVTGFGIANMLRFGITGNNLNYWSITWNSFFLFFLNATLVALATFMIVRLLHFPMKSFESLKEERKNRTLLIGVSLLMLTITIFTSYRIISENRKVDNIRNFIHDQFGDIVSGEPEIKKNIEDNIYEVKVVLMANLAEGETEYYNELIKEKPYEVDNARIKCIDFGNMDEELKKRTMEGEARGEEKVRAQLHLQQKRQQLIDSLNNEITSVKISKIKDLETKLKDIAKISFPEIENCEFYRSENSKTKPHNLAVKWNPRVSNNKRIREEKEERLKKMVIELVDLDTLILTHSVD